MGAVAPTGDESAHGAEHIHVLVHTSVCVVVGPE